MRDVMVANSLFYGLYFIISRPHDAALTSLRTSFQTPPGGNKYRIKFEAGSATKVDDYGFNFLLIVQPNCPADASKVLNPARNDCIAACPTSYYADTCGRCQACHISCWDCLGPNVDECTTCHSTSKDFTQVSTGPVRGTCACKFYFIEKLTPDRTCDTCHYSCKTCSVKDQADKCVTCDAAVRALTGTSCPCNAGTTDVAQACVPCGTNCAACENGIPANCTSCLTIFWLDTVADTCGAVCPAGQYHGATAGVCSLCSGVSPNFCLTCSSLTSCDSCVTGKFLHNNACLGTCPAKFYGENKLCKPCKTECATCTTLALCQSCEPNFWHDPVLNSCPTSCPSGQYQSATPWTCALCSGVSPNFCLTCSSLTSCDSCINGKFLHNNACLGTCPAKFYGENKLCKPCRAECATCTTLALCQSCEPNFWHDPVLSNCAATCPSGQYQSATPWRCALCVSASPHFCSTCTTMADCQSCAMPKALYQQRCVGTCPRGYYASSQVCTLCQPSCTSCTALN